MDISPERVWKCSFLNSRHRFLEVCQPLLSLFGDSSVDFFISTTPGGARAILPAEATGGGSLAEGDAGAPFVGNCSIQ